MTSRHLRRGLIAIPLGEPSNPDCLKVNPTDPFFKSCRTHFLSLGNARVTFTTAFRHYLENN
jgi:hypothetical protein